jgi:glycosyltransferase involved in cell wall biosynthesis
MNPTARYYHCDELLRPPFYQTTWKISKITRHTIYASSALYPLKGFHVLLKAVMLLRREFPDITVRTPMGRFFHSTRGAENIWKRLRSCGYANYLTNLIRQEGLEKHISSLGVLDAARVANELGKSHVFVLPSFIENSPNSLAEAMSIGTPSIASLVGGVPSMVNDGESALCFPSGDASVLALQIRQIFLDDELAVHLSTQARKVSLARHDKDKISSTMLDIYRKEIVAQSK